MASSSRSLALALLLISGLYTSSSATSGGHVDGNDLLMMDRFHQWMAKHNRSYPSIEEKLLRFEIYSRNVEYIEATNKQAGLTYELGENEFTDLTNEEFMAMYTGPPLPADEEDDLIITTRTGPINEGANLGYGNLSMGAPDSIDWREKGAVTPPKNQRKCGSCWAFSAIATVEGLHQIKTGELLSLSEQELLDCDHFEHGCKGGSHYRALRWIYFNGGITTESDYPYEAKQGECNYSKTHNHAAKITGYRMVQSNSEEALKNAVANQPIAVSIEAGGKNFQHYKSGIYTGPCGTKLNHGVTVVGYGAGADAEGVKYWIVKNSWGQNWGDNGFILMKRGTDKPQGLCGIAMQPSYPMMRP